MHPRARLPSGSLEVQEEGKKIFGKVALLTAVGINISPAVYNLMCIPTGILYLIKNLL